MLKNKKMLSTAIALTLVGSVGVGVTTYASAEAPSGAVAGARMDQVGTTQTYEATITKTYTEGQPTYKISFTNKLPGGYQPVIHIDKPSPEMQKQIDKILEDGKKGKNEGIIQVDPPTDTDITIDFGGGQSISIPKKDIESDKTGGFQIGEDGRVTPHAEIPQANPGPGKDNLVGGPKPPKPPKEEPVEHESVQKPAGQDGAATEESVSKEDSEEKGPSDVVPVPEEEGPAAEPPAGPTTESPAGPSTEPPAAVQPPAPSEPPVVEPEPSEEQVAPGLPETEENQDVEAAPDSEHHEDGDAGKVEEGSTGVLPSEDGAHKGDNDTQVSAPQDPSDAQQEGVKEEEKTQEQEHSGTVEQDTQGSTAETVDPEHPTAPGEDEHKQEQAGVVDEDGTHVDGTHVEEQSSDQHQDNEVKDETTPVPEKKPEVLPHEEEHMQGDEPGISTNPSEETNTVIPGTGHEEKEDAEKVEEEQHRPVVPPAGGSQQPPTSGVTPGHESVDDQSSAIVPDEEEEDQEHDSLPPNPQEASKAIAEMQSSLRGAATAANSIWLAEQNDVQKRLGELHEMTGESGVWARTYGGKYEMSENNLDATFKGVQIGYDTKVSDAWRVGVAGSYVKTDSDYLGGNAKTSLKGLTVYGTMQGQHNDYVDLVAKYARVNNDVNIFTAGTQTVYASAATKANGISFSAEYGRKFERANGVYLEPQVELTYGHLGVMNYNFTGQSSLAVAQDGINTFTTRVGLSVGKKLENGHVFTRLSLSHRFGADVDIKAPVEEMNTKTNLRETWVTLGLGGTFKLGKATNLYANFERSFGGDLRLKWRGDVGIRYNF